MTDTLKLGIDGFDWKRLQTEQGVADLFSVFCREFQQNNSIQFESYKAYLDGATLDAVAESKLLIEVADHVSEFIERLFLIETEISALRLRDTSFDCVFLFKRDFVQRRALKKYPDSSSLSGADVSKARDLFAALLGSSAVCDSETTLASLIVPLLTIEKHLETSSTLSAEDCNKLSSIAVHAANHGLPSFDAADAVACRTGLNAFLNLIEVGVADFFYSSRAQAAKWVSFIVPHKLNFENLVHIERFDGTLPEKIKGPDAHLRRRDGFRLTDRRMNAKMAMGQVDYCIYCHDREKDSCSKGLKDKKTGEVQKNALGIALKGCPLDEKISESHFLRKRGDVIGALAMVVVDNPMCPGTGHRICNDCMKSCIFQKQEPVNIPEIETNTLMSVLELPYGFEIYSLLTRWNPLNRKRPFARTYNGMNVLVVGMGPAGYTLAHYLLNEGFAVVGVDGLKIEPLPEALIHNPVRDLKQLTKELDQRVLNGFGGVAEYGITVRWDKNFLTVIYLNLFRRSKFQLYGGTRFGGTITVEDAWKLGFDHIAMATGAGKPTIVPMKNNLIRGVRKASDFLMGLQLTGAFQSDNMANLQVRLPAVVVGGGLTGIDTATEILAYYPLQVEKILKRHETLVAQFGEARVLERLSVEDKIILKEFLGHGRAVRSERERAKVSGEKPNFIPLIRQWGGVNLIYRKSLNDSPAYRLNHEEVTKAFEEGIYFVENFSPVECHRDEFGSLDGVSFERQAVTAEGKWRSTGEIVRFPAKALCVAAGTSPNIIYEKEFPGTFELDEWKYFFKKFREDGEKLIPADKRTSGFFTSYDLQDKRISFYGDNHPDYAGNVVKAMASAKDGYPHVVSLFQSDIDRLDVLQQAARELSFIKFAKALEDQLVARVESVTRLTPTIIEVIVKAPMAARNFKPGQFYRMQNYEADAVRIDGTKLSTEGLALTGAWTDVERGLLSMIILEMGTSSRLCGALRAGQRVVVMGPTGTPTEIPQNETVLLAGGGLGNAVLFSIGQALKSAGNRVLYFAGYKNSIDVFKQDDIEAGTDLVIWANDVGSPIKPRRKQDRSFSGNIVQAMVQYAEGKLGDVTIPLDAVDRIIAIGSDRMMAAVKEARFTVLKPFLKKDHLAIGSINSTMQCMMKEVCAQCLQKHVDPVTGEEAAPVFSCFNQDQHLDCVDFKNLNERLQTNHLSEVLSGLWLDYLFSKQDVQRV